MLRRFRCLVICLFGLGALATKVQGIVILHTEPTTAYAELGEVLHERGMFSVSGSINGSAMAIAPDWLLTAAHVVASSEEVRVSGGNFSRTTDQIFVHPGWGVSPEVGLDQGSDLALLHVPGAHFDFVDIATAVSPGDLGLLGGYGRSGNGLVGATLTFGDPLGAHNIIDRAIVTTGGRLLVTDFDSGFMQHNTLESQTVNTVFYDSGFPESSLSVAVLGEGSSAIDPPASVAFRFLEGTTAEGDSGGPLLRLNPLTDAWELAGVTSWGTNPLFPSGASRQASRYGDLTFFTDVSVHRDWVLTTIPEPNSVLLILCGMLFFVLNPHRIRRR